MQLARPIALALLVLPLVGGASQGAAQEAPAASGGATISEAMARLVPADALFYVHFASLAGVERDLRAVVSEVDPGQAMMVDAEMLIGSMVPADLSLIDRRRPFGVAAIVDPFSKQAVPVFVIPTEDPNAFVTSLSKLPGRPEPVSLGDYVAVSLHPDYAMFPEPNPLVADMPEGDVVLRVDLERAFEVFGKEIDAGLDEISRQAKREMELQPEYAAGMQGVFDAYVAMLDDAVSSAQRFELALVLERATVDVHASLRVREGSALSELSWGASEGLDRVASRVDWSQPIAFASGFDPERIMQRLAPGLEQLVASYPPALRERFDGFLEANESFFPLLGDAIGAYGGFGAHGYEIAAFLCPPDAGALFDRYERVLSDPAMAEMGVVFEPAGEREVEGVRIRDYRYRVDADLLAEFEPAGASLSAEELERLEGSLRALFGGDAMRVSLATYEGLCALVFGGSEERHDAMVLGILGTPAEPPPGVDRARERIGSASPSCLFRLDLGLFFRQLGQLPILDPEDRAELQQMPTVPIPLLVFGAVDGSEWSGGFSFDAKALAQLSRLAEVSQGGGL